MSQHVYRSPFLPVGIAMAALSLGFTFSSDGLHWLWHSEPHIAVVLASLGTIFVAVHLIQRARHLNRDGSGTASH